MIEYGAFTCVIIAVGYICFRAGQASKAEPSEEAMIQRLMKSRMNSGMENAIRYDIERRINQGRL